MAAPTTRAEFKEYCLRRLGKPVIEINVDEDQVEDRVDDALRYYWDYHFDGSERTFYKYRVQGNESLTAVANVSVANGGTSYSNSDTVVFTPVYEAQGSGATANVVTDANGTISSITMTANGSGYDVAPTVTITTSTGSGASLTANLGDGSITLPNNIIGAVRLFSIGDPSVRSDDLFNIRYQIALNDMYTLTSVSMVPYYTTMEHLALISELLVGKQPIRFNRHKNQVFVDMNWGSVAVGEYLLIEAYKVIDPATYSEAWADHWLMKYATALIKRQWGSNLTKFVGMQLPGGVQFNGEKIYDDAVQEIQTLEQEMITNYSLPVMDMIG